MENWPERLYDLVYIPDQDQKLDDLKNLAEKENWGYQNTEDEHHLPILFNYIQYTYKRLAQEDKITISDTGQFMSFNTGLVTENQESIFAFCNTNKREDAEQNWFFQGWKRKGEYDMTKFSSLPEMTHYFDDPSTLVMDARLEIRANIEHIVTENKERFPYPYKDMEDYALQTLIKGAIDNAKERVRRNYKTAIPHFYKDKVQLMLPLCLAKANKADLALVIVKHEGFYRATTCLTLDMAYNNARQLAKPDRDWLIP